MISRNSQELQDKLAENELENQEFIGSEIPDSVADTRLLDAEKAGNQQRFYADLLRSFQSVLQGAAPTSGFKADPSLANSIESRANQPMERVKAQLAQEAAGRKEAREQEEFGMRKEEHASKQKESEMRQDDFQMKLEKSKLDFQDMEANRDPASPQSKIAQDRVLEVQAKLKQPVNEAQIRGMSGEQLYKSFAYLQDDLTQHYKNENARLDREQKASHDKAMLDKEDKRLEAEKGRWEEGEKRRADELKRREDKDATQARQQQINTARGLIKDDPRFKKTMEQSMAFEDVGQLIKEAEAGNQQAVGALGTKLARAMGEVGVLTDTDVVRYVAGQSWGRKLKDWFTKGAKGELSPETIKGIKANIKVLREKMDGDVKKVVDNSAARMKAAYPEMKDEDIRGILGFQSLQSSEPETVNMRGPDGKVRAVPKNQVEAAKKAGGEVI